MGNYGNTVDRWYKRPALLMWPRPLAFTNRAETSPAAALRAVLVRLADRDETTVLNDLRGMVRGWPTWVRKARFASSESSAKLLTVTFAGAWAWL